MIALLLSHALACAIGILIGASVEAGLQDRERKRREARLRSAAKE